jgi:hypothetical protein
MEMERNKKTMLKNALEREFNEKKKQFEIELTNQQEKCNMLELEVAKLKSKILSIVQNSIEIKQLNISSMRDSLSGSKISAMEQSVIKND